MPLPGGGPPNRIRAPGQAIRFCTGRDGIRIAYAVSGAGPPLVKAANWLTHIEFDLTSPVWQHWWAELSREHTLVRYDERGCGLSDRDVADFSFESLVRDLEAVVDASGLDRFCLFGMSHGGPIAIAYAVRHPERVTRLVLYGSFACGRYLDAKSPAEIEENKLIFQFAEIGWEQDNPAYRQMFSTLFLPGGSPEHHDAFAEMLRLSTSGANAGRLLREVAMFDVRSLAPNVSCPTLVLHARNDGRTSFERGRALAALIPHARFVPLDGRNHILVENEPAWQQFISEFRAFLPTKAADGEPHRFSTLSKRERQVLELIAQGHDNHHIAKRLFLSAKTIRNHINHIFSKLEVLNRGEAIVRAREAGFGRATGSTGN